MHKARKAGMFGAAILTAGLVAAAPWTTPAQAGYDPYTGSATGSVSTTVRTGTTTTLRAGQNITVVGTLSGAATDDRFVMRDAAGRAFTVETRRISRDLMPNQLVDGDVVRVYGNWTGDILQATNLRRMGRTLAAPGSRITVDTYTYVVGSRNTYTGTLTTDADDDVFVINTTDGRSVRVHTHLLPNPVGMDSRPWNSLVVGDRVRVYGTWGMDDEGRAVLDASNVQILSSRLLQ